MTYCCRVRMRGQGCKARFQNKRALLCHMRFQHRTCHLIKCMVRTNECPYCRSTFATKHTAQQHAVQAIISSTCKTDQGHYNTKLQTLESLECPLCEYAAKNTRRVSKTHNKTFSKTPAVYCARRSNTFGPYSGNRNISVAGRQKVPRAPRRSEKRR